MSGKGSLTSQFRNEKVGEGYQAKHVVRQKKSSVEKVQIIDKTQPKKKKRRREEKKLADLQRYLHCRGFREFRKEIEQMTKE